MPKAGTKRVVVNGEERWVPAEEADLFEVVSRALVLIQLVKTSQAELRKLKGRVEVISAERGQRTLKTITGQVARVSPTRSVSVSGEAVEELSKQIALAVADEDEALEHLDQLFTAKQVVTWSVAKTHKDWLDRLQPKPLEALKEQVKACVTVKPGATRVDFEEAKDKDAKAA